MDSMYRLLNNYGKVRGNESMRKHTSIECGGKVNYLVIVEQKDELVELLTELDNSGINYFILGGGYNTLVSQSGFDGVVVKNQANDMKVVDNELQVESGADITKAAKYSMSNNLYGFEMGVGAVGSIGGNVVGNEKIKNKSLSSVITEVKAYKSGEEVVYKNKDCEFDCDTSIFETPGMVVSEVTMKLEKGESEAEQSLEYLKYKSSCMPAMKASIGPLFKHVDKNKIEKSKLEQKSLNEIDSKKWIKPKLLLEQLEILTKNNKIKQYENNPNFLIKEGKAEPKDVISLIENIEHSVYDTYGVELKRKVSTIGF